jgi:hypothetical protein
MITCEDFAQRVTAYLEGATPISERMGMWLHKTMCHHCRLYLDQMKFVVNLMEDVPDRDPADGPAQGNKQDLLETFRQRTLRDNES